MDINIRSALPGDAAAIANLHVLVWRETYRTLASPDAFRELDEAHRQARWAATLAEPGRDQLVLLAEQGDRPVGIGSVGAPSHAVFEGRGEIRSLYVHPSLKRRGLGRRLMRELARHLADRRYPGVALSVVAGNEPAIAFYRSLGGRMAGRYIDPGPLWRSDNIVFVWDDLSLLI
ncbi:GNAT family N-acetyltransferase [Rhizobium leucaenae]|uniref:Ribosomal protein S18 acetylase RimI-like enzyme n=1 Tax=Rhizobium leucaenae TaxID=29450 RepID=A0A7W6ZVX0_9HYPH|nr:GNAT family N-acetyltransferase [Rhizobium leucaenae]MBB4569741.1 ribosomal protein S18 acetylase RimI-like enzyme [Rhizobium leucaenae]MBB6299746.1 ribosomal protein S18 acetylase RimI-like enzyme [Rhizobium leucaenae]